MSLPIAGWWVLFCALCSCAGLGLSALHELNAGGYAVVLGALAVGLVVARKKIQWPRCNWRKSRRRFRRLLPACYLAVFALALLGGILHPPSNYDGLAYRTPRVLHWLAHGEWHWIHTAFDRVNTRGTSFEWVTAPIIALTRTDRLLFLINVVSFLLLPGLVFGMFRRLGVRRRVAWSWMWVLPTGYCFLLQAGSIGNDLFGAVFPLAAIYFALRARRSGKALDVWVSALAAALMSASKTSNVLLVLPWLLAIAPSWRLVTRRFVPSVAVAVVALVVSFLPEAWLNWRHCGDWTGAVAEHMEGATRASPLRVANNAVLIVLQNVTPPVMPVAKKWNELVARKTPPEFRKALEASFEPKGAHWGMGEMEVEEDAGLGLGVSALLVVSLVAGVVYGRRKVVDQAAKLVFVGTWIALAVFVTKSGMSTVARVLAPYYGLMVAAVLVVGDQERVVKARWWRGFAAAVFAVGAMLLILSPARPLWPANTVLGKGAKNGLMGRAQTVYSVYGQRADAFAQARKLLPPDERVIGMVTMDDPETSMWRPFFQRRVEHVIAGDTGESLRAQGIHYVLVSRIKFPMAIQQDFEGWLKEMQGEVSAKVVLPLRATDGPSEWVLVRVGP